MKKLLLILSLLLFTACGSKKFYTLGENLNITATTTCNQTIDVVKVTVPKYLKEHKIVRQVSPYEIELIKKAQWLIPMDKKLTQILIDYLQQSLNNPKVHLYPWESDNKTDKRVSVDIKKFIASKEKVMLKANYKVTNIKNNSNKIKLFETSINTNSANMQSMMQSMEIAYLQLLDHIKETIINNK